MRDYKKEIIKKHLLKEEERLNNIENFLLSKNNLQEVILDPLSKIYYIENKSGNLKENYTAQINSKMRLIIKPIGDYPYNIAEIDELLFESIDNKHYGEG